MKIRTKRRACGFTLVEMLIAMMVFVIGVLAVAVMIIYGIRMQVFAGNATTASSFAKAKIEQLRVLPAADPQRAIGAGHTELVPSDMRFRRNWTIVAGPAGTLDVTVTVVPADPVRMQIPPTQMRSIILP